MSRKKKERRYASSRERAEKHDAGFSAPYLKIPEGAAQFKPKTGFMLLDILAYEVGKGNPFADEGMLHYERTFYVHRGIGSNNDSFLCAAKTLGKPCPICEHRAKLRRSSDDDDETEKLIYALKPSERQLFNLINLKDPEKGVQIWDFSHFLFGKKLDEEIRASDEDDGWENFASYDKGLTLKVNFSEDSFGGSTFQRVETVHFKPRKTEYDEDEMLEKVFCLDDVLVETPYDKLKEIFLQTPSGDDDDDDEDEDEKPVKKKAASKKKPVDDDDDDDDDDGDDDGDVAPFKKKAVKSKAIPDDDDDDDDDGDDDEDEDEKSVKKSAKKKAPVDDDDEDDDDEDEDDDDEDEKSVKKSAKKSSKKDDDDWDDFDDDDDDEEEAPKKKTRRG